MPSNRQAPGSMRDVVSKDNVENNLERHSISTSGFHTQVHKHIYHTHTFTYTLWHIYIICAQVQQNIYFLDKGLSYRAQDLEHEEQF